MCNPFSPLLDPNKLICLKSGMAVNDHIASQLLEFKNTGKKWMNEFIDDCKSDPKQFKKRLPRRQVPNCLCYAWSINSLSDLQLNTHCYLCPS